MDTTVELEREVRRELAKGLAENLGNAAVRCNQAAGYDATDHLVRIQARRVAWIEAVRAISPKDGSVGSILAVLKRRFAGLRKTVLAAAHEAPSVARYVRVSQALGEALLSCAAHQDCLFELSGSFRRGLGLLAERPKTVRRVSAPDDLLLSDREKRRVAACVCKLLATIAACADDCYVRHDDGGAALARPPRFDRVAERYGGAEIEATFFRAVRKGLWAYDGAAFREIRRHVGVVNAPCYDAEEVEEELAGMMSLNLPVWLQTEHGAAVLTLVLSAMASGGEDPDKVAAAVDAAVRGLALAAARGMSEKLEAQMVERRAQIAETEKRNAKRKKAALAKVAALKVGNAACRKAIEEAHAKLLDQIFDIDLNCIKEKHQLDEEAWMVRQQMAALPPPRPKAVPPPPYRGSERHHSKFYGQTLGQTIGKKIKVGQDGVTFTCPTLVGGKKVERSYKMEGEKQLVFLDVLLAAYKKDETAWVTPPVPSRVWQASYFKRAEAKLFLADGHIVSEKTENGKYTGRIRLSV